MFDYKLSVLAVINALEKPPSKVEVDDTTTKVYKGSNWTLLYAKIIPLWFMMDLMYDGKWIKLTRREKKRLVKAIKVYHNGR